jgi:hypothetical protein
MELDVENYSSLSNKDLLDLKGITEEGLNHYDLILKNLSEQKEEFEVIRKEYELCKKYTLEDYYKIIKEIKSRNLPLKNEYQNPSNTSTTDG